jgi:hypothetical protein
MPFIGFSGSGSLRGFGKNVLPPGVTGRASTVEYLVVAGGGGGGGNRGGGGGAGGVLTGTSYAVALGSVITVTVGGAGALGGENARGGTGGTSSIASTLGGTVTASGGGGITELTADVTTPAASSGVTAATLATPLKTGSFGVTVDGVTAIVQVGKVGYVTIPYGGTITGWSITSNAVGNIQFDIWKAAGAIPTTTIVSDSTYPALVADDFQTSTAVSGWITTFAAGDVFGFQVIGSPTVIKNATLTLRCTKLPS